MEKVLLPAELLFRPCLSARAAIDNALWRFRVSKNTSFSKIPINHFSIIIFFFCLTPLLLLERFCFNFLKRYNYFYFAFYSHHCQYIGNTIITYCFGLTNIFPIHTYTCGKISINLKTHILMTASNTMSKSSYLVYLYYAYSMTA